MNGGNWFRRRSEVVGIRCVSYESPHLAGGAGGRAPLSQSFAGSGRPRRGRRLAAEAACPPGRAAARRRAAGDAGPGLLAVGWPSWRAASTSRGKLSRNTDESKRRAFAMQASVSTEVVSKRSTASASSSGPPSQRQPVTPSTTFSSRPPGGARDHRAAGRLGLHGGDAELLAGGHHERPAGREQAGRLGVAHPPGEADRRAGEPPQPPAVGPAARHHERQPQAVEGLDRHVDLLVGHELGEHEVVAADRLGPEALGRDRRVDDPRVAPEVRLDARLGGARVRHVAVHTLGRDPVPLAPAPEQAAQHRARDRLVALGQRPVTLVPGVAERVVAVGDVHARSSQITACAHALELEMTRS